MTDTVSESAVLLEPLGDTEVSGLIARLGGAWRTRQAGRACRDGLFLDGRTCIAITRVRKRRPVRTYEFYRTGMPFVEGNCATREEARQQAEREFLREHLENVATIGQCRHISKDEAAEALARLVRRNELAKIKEEEEERAEYLKYGISDHW